MVVEFTWSSWHRPPGQVCSSQVTTPFLRSEASPNRSCEWGKHGHHCATEAVVLAGVGVRAIRFHLVGGAGVVGGDVIDLGLHHIPPLAKPARGFKDRDRRYRSGSGQFLPAGWRCGVFLLLRCCKTMSFLPTRLMLDPR